MKLISELSESVQTLVESKGGNKTYFIEGIFAQSNKANRNGRIYPRQYMESALNNFQKVIESKRAMGELNHPSGPTINLDRVSHLIEYMKWDGDNVLGRAKILDTPMGKIAQGLLEGGVQLGVSTRGLGSLKQVGGLNEVQSDFTLNTVDIVGDPSAPDAFVNGIMEGVEWVRTKDGRIEERTFELIKKNKLTEERKLKAFANFILSVNESVEVEHDAFEFSSGKKPSGHGSWVFTRDGIQHRLDFNKHKEGKDWFQHNGTYGEAKTAAKKWAKSVGHSIIHVAP